MSIEFYTCPECGGKMIKISGFGFSCGFCGHIIRIEN